MDSSVRPGGSERRRVGDSSLGTGFLGKLCRQRSKRITSASTVFTTSDTVLRMSNERGFDVLELY